MPLGPPPPKPRPRKEYGKDLAAMTEDDLEEMESDLENDRVWSDALASYEMIRQAREIVASLPQPAESA